MQKKEYIERGAILRKSETMFDGQKYCTAVNTGFIYTAPAADVVEVVHGEWMPVSDDDQYEGEYYCSVCNAEEFFPGNAPFAPFCWHCGAKMDGGKEE